ncbi:inositol monophosphatase family protein [Gynuella sunshinyii]|nr:inositol monophosphatase family protein [Gynuella sunshinyii]
MQPTLTIAMRAARAAAEKMKYTYQQTPALLDEGYSLEKIFTDAMEGAAARVVKSLWAAHPTHNIIFKQLGEHPAKNPEHNHKWYVNLLDGDLNFQTGYPAAAICVAHAFRDKFEQVAIINIFNDEEFGCVRGRGMTRNEQRVRVTSVRRLDGISSGVHGFDTDPSWVACCGTHNINQRIIGSGLLTLSYFCSGFTDACVVNGMSEHDMSVAALLLQESGAIAGDRKGKPLFANSAEIVAANPKLFKVLLQAL